MCFRCEREPQNEHSVHAWKIITQNHRMIGHMPDSLAKVLTELNNKDLITDVMAKITGYRQGAPGGTWSKGGGVVLPCTYKIYGKQNNMQTVRHSIVKYCINRLEIMMYGEIMALISHIPYASLMFSYLIVFSIASLIF